MMETAMKIGELARRAGVGVDTLRYYEKEGLLPPPRRMASGYRSYAASDVQRVQFVRRSKTLGFTLPEIRELLALSDDDRRDMAALRETARRKLADLDTRLAELHRVRDGLALLVESCPGHGQLRTCPILGALAGEAA
jgi:MerR family transcriptional regulator, copper efflux regulator